MGGIVYGIKWELRSRARVSSAEIA